jgi:hypothetical protein
MARLLATVAAITTFVGLAGCSKGGDAEGVATTDSPIGQSATTSPPQPDMVAAQGESFERFWMVFRQAVLAGDKDRVASMTRFPFETRGTMDDDPVKTHDRASFLRILDRLLTDDDADGTERRAGRYRGARRQLRFRACRWTMAFHARLHRRIAPQLSGGR